ncbi:MAG: caspase family protein, partial [Spirochaetota bacterium]
MRALRRRPLSFALLTLALPATSLLPGCGRLEELPPGYAIVYGVSDYYPSGPSSNDLAYPDDDAEDISAMLASQGYTVIARTNASATKAQLVADFESVAAEVEAGSRFFFYFAGHGFGDGMES